MRYVAHPRDARMPMLRMPTIPNTDAWRRVILENCHAR